MQLNIARWDIDVKVCFDSHVKYWNPASKYSHINIHLFPYQLMITTLLQHIICYKSVTFLPPLKEGVPGINHNLNTPSSFNLLWEVRSKNIVKLGRPQCSQALAKIPYPYCVHFCESWLRWIDPWFDCSQNKTLLGPDNL